MIGLKRGTVKLVRRSPEWVRSFNREAAKIRRIFGEEALQLEHVGSTAIPGIPAKPIIDMALVVPSLKKAKRFVNRLKAIGYELKREDLRKERLFFAKGTEKKRTHYLHIGENGSGYVEDMILFRNYLRKHRSVARQYSELKAKLAERYSATRELYTAMKGKLVRDIVRKARRTSSLEIRKKSKMFHRI